jgi:hypothetical protein
MNLMISGSFQVLCLWLEFCNGVSKLCKKMHVGFNSFLKHFVQVFPKVWVQQAKIKTYDFKKAVIV